MWYTAIEFTVKAAPAASCEADRGLTTVLDQRKGQVAATQDAEPVPALFQTEREAAATVQHITESPAGCGAWRDGCHRLLEDTCRVAGVGLGTFDEQVLLELADGEPPTVAVIAGLIRRAHAAGLEEGRDALGAAGVVLPGGGWISGPST